MNESEDKAVSPTVHKKKQSSRLLQLIPAAIIAVMSYQFLLSAWQGITYVRGRLPVINPQQLHLTGHLLMALRTQGVADWNLTTGDVTTLFRPPSDGRVNEAVLSPDGSILVLTYAAPSSSSIIQLGFTDLYSMPADGSSPPTLLTQAGSGRLISSPAWSPDGTTLYFVLLQTGALGLTQLDLLQMNYISGIPQILIENAHAPNISHDGTQIVYVKVNRYGADENLYISSVTGGTPLALLTAEKFATIDKPQFSHNGKILIFGSSTYSLVDQPQPEQTAKADWIDRLSGIHVALAHSIPSYLWSIPTTGGEPTRLTNQSDYGFSADFSPDDQFIAFACGTGIYIMNSNGSKLFRISDQSTVNSLQWVP